jgi:hypothetical protein
MSPRGRPPTARPYEHAAKVYREMAHRSVALADAGPEVRALADQAGGTVPDGARVFIGDRGRGLVALFEELGYRSRAQYQQIKANLISAGCLVRLRRGTGAVTAIWLLGPEPTPERWRGAVQTPGQQRAVGRVEAEHHVRLGLFLHELPSTAPTLAEELRLAGCRTVRDALDYLRKLPPVRLAAFGPGCCLAFVGGDGHTCGLRSTLEPAELASGVRLVN